MRQILRRLVAILASKPERQPQVPTRLAIVVRGPPCSGKSYVKDYLKRSLTKGTEPLDVTLDIHSGPPNDNRPRTYSNLDFVAGDYILIELGYGGDATKRPNVWGEKLRRQGFKLILFQLKVSLDLARQRCKEREDWRDEWTEEWWKRYRTDEDILALPARLNSQEITVDTTGGLEKAAKMILRIALENSVHHD